ncbi:MAG: glycerophosphodiester phosphodiesterase [Myxococcota bacterium]
MSSIRVIAHRGASGDCPENTLPAFERAIEQSADMIETDLHLSRDGVVVIHHDADLERLGRAGEIRDLTAEELFGLDAAPTADVEAKMPTLLELLDGFGERMEFNLELKVGSHAPYEGMEAIVVEAVKERGLLPRMLFSSFDDGVLERVRALSAEARIAVLASPRAPLGLLKRAHRVRAEAVNPHISMVTKRMVRSAHAASLRVFPYTANEEKEMRRLIQCGVDGIITNYPEHLRTILASS